MEDLLKYHSLTERSVIQENLFQPGLQFTNGKEVLYLVKVQLFLFFPPPDSRLVSQPTTVPALERKADFVKTARQHKGVSLMQHLICGLL